MKTIAAFDFGLRPIGTAPMDGRYILLFGPSGYRTTPMRCVVGKYDGRRRNPWVDHAGDSFEDGGASPTHWMPHPSMVPASLDDEIASEEAAKSFLADRGYTVTDNHDA